MTDETNSREERALGWLRVGQRWWDPEDQIFVTILGLDPGTMYPVQYQWDGERSDARNTAVGFLANFQPPSLLEFLESTRATPSPETGTAAVPTKARCVRCFAAYAADGSCSRRQEGCQGGRGEWVAAVSEAATAIAAGPAHGPAKPPVTCGYCGKSPPGTHWGYCHAPTPAAGIAPTPQCTCFHSADRHHPDRCRGLSPGGACGCLWPGFATPAMGGR